MNNKYTEDLFYHRYKSSVAGISAHFFPSETGRMRNKPKEQMMCPFCFNKQIGDEHQYIFNCTHPKFIPIRTEHFEAIFELADRNTYSYQSTQDLLFKLQSVSKKYRMSQKRVYKVNQA